METSKTIAVRQAFVLTREELRLIDQVIPESHRRVIEVTCRDKVLRKYHSITEFEEFENPANKEILELLFMSFDTSDDKSIAIHLRSQYPSTSIIVICKGPEDYLTTILNKLEDRFSSMKPWYSLLAQHGAFFIFIVLEIPFVCNLISHHNSSYTLSDLGSDIARTPLPLLAMAAFVIISFSVLVWLCLYVIERIRRYVFPLGAFAIGQGVKRYQNREVLRLVVIIGFVVNLAAGVVLWVFTR